MTAPTRRRLATGAAALGIAIATLAPTTASAAEDSYPPPAFGGGSTTLGTTFQEPQSPSPARLPATGRDLRALVALGLLGTVLGALSVLAGRERSPREPAALMVRAPRRTRPR